jgi:signal transduction histidine kinase/ligand-binding sensor domain-containing protein
VRIDHTYCVKFILVFWLGFARLAGTAEVVSSSDDYVVQVWDTDSGLPHSTVTSVVQTPDGYIWAGTLLGGLARFDGSRFVSFHPGNTPELRSIEIFKLLVGDNGTLWVGGVDGSLVSCRNGKFCFEFDDAATPASLLNAVVSSSDRSVILSSLSGRLFSSKQISGTNKWTTFQTPDFGGTQMPNFGGDPCEDRDGAIWYRTAGGRLAKIVEGNMIRLDNPSGLRSPNVNKLLKDNSGHLWVGTDQEIAVWDGKTFVDMTPSNGQPDFAVRDLAFCRDGSLWVRTDDQLRRCKDRKWLAEAGPWDGQFPPSIRSLQMYGDSRGGVWVIHYGQGLWHIDRGGHVSRVGEQQGLPNGFVEDCCEDSEGNFWVGLRDGGLACIRLRVFHVVWPAEGWKNESMRSICEDSDGAMWFGVAGPTILRWFDGAFTGLTPPAERFPGTETAVLPAGPGRLWVGTARNGLWSLEQGEFKRPFPQDDISTVVRCLFLDHTGALWIGSEYGLWRWDKGALKRFTATDGFSPAYILSLAEDKTGDMWFGTAAGELRRLHLGKFESFAPSDSPGSLNFNFADTKAAQTPPPGHDEVIFGRERFWALHFDDDGVLWIGTLGDGLLRFKDGLFTRFTTRNGLPNDHVSQILEDDLGRLWLGTRAGISRVNKHELTAYANGSQGPVNFITYGRSDGLPTVECSGGIQPACWKSRDGKLWFSTAKGPVWVDPSALHFNHLPPPVQIEEVLVDGNRMAGDIGSSAGPGVPVPGQIRIAPGRHHFEFKFTALSFTSPDKVRFQWRLKGLESDWVDGGNRRTISYSFLQAGEYQFEVRACNNDGVWNQADMSVALTVLPYFWETWWFKICVMSLGLLILLGVVLTIQRRRYRVRMQKLERQHDLELERTRIARDIHDQIGANLTKIGMQTSILEREPDLTPACQPLVRGVAESTREMLRSMDEIVWAINPRNDTLENSVNYLIQYTRGFLRPLNIDYKLEVPVNLPDVPLTTEMRHNLFMAFKEALNNAVKHGHPHHIVIALEVAAQQLKFSVADDGCGFILETCQPGADGLENMRQRLASIGGRSEIESVPGRGTKVIFQLPLPLES